MYLKLFFSVAAFQIASFGNLWSLDKGDHIPDVNVKTTEGESLNLSELSQGKATVVIFFRGAWSPYCVQHLAWYSAIQDDLTSMGYQSIAICADQPERLVDYANSHKNSNLKILSDSPLAAAEAFDVVYEVKPEEMESYEAFGIDLNLANGRDDNLLARPSAFIFNEAGELVFHYLNTENNETVHTNIIMAAAKKYAPLTPPETDSTEKTEIKPMS